MSKRANFPTEFQKILILKSTNYTHLEKAMARRGYSLSKQFICQMALGNRSVPALQLHRICDTLQCSEEERRALHLAACRDNGFYV